MAARVPDQILAELPGAARIAAATFEQDVQPWQQDQGDRVQRVEVVPDVPPGRRVGRTGRDPGGGNDAVSAGTGDLGRLRRDDPRGEPVFDADRIQLCGGRHGLPTECIGVMQRAADVVPVQEDCRAFPLERPECCG